MVVERIADQWPVASRHWFQYQSQLQWIVIPFDYILKLFVDYKDFDTIHKTFEFLNNIELASDLN